MVLQPTPSTCSQMCFPSSPDVGISSERSLAARRCWKRLAKNCKEYWYLATSSQVRLSYKSKKKAPDQRETSVTGSYGLCLCFWCLTTRFFGMTYTSVCALFVHQFYRYHWKNLREDFCTPKMAAGGTSDRCWLSLQPQ